MFRTWEFDVKGVLRERGNRLEIRFDSPLPFLAERERIRHLPDWHGPREVDGRAWLRKEPCSFGWDWGPRLASCGPWKSVTRPRVGHGAGSRTCSCGRIIRSPGGSASP